MPHELLRRRQFLEDYREIVVSIGDKDASAANRFCDAVEAALAIFIVHPEIGPKAGFPKAPDARFWPLRGFRNYLLFYRVAGNSIIVLRLLHAARNLPPLVPTE